MKSEKLIKYSGIISAFICMLTPIQLLKGEAGIITDTTIYSNRPDKFVTIDIKSAIDGKMQKAWFYKSTSVNPQPLIVSLHTWSGDFNQDDPLAAEVLMRDWNYISPDFRGPCNNPDACGSEKVINDIQEAILYAVKNGNVDTSDIHIIGVSGGGYHTLVAFMKLDYPVRSFNAWASISDLGDWYWECRGRGLKYADDLVMVTSGGNGFDLQEAIKRSPLHMTYPEEKRKGSVLNIYAGIHDGYTGSVPISHSVNFFNKLVKEVYPDRQNTIVSENEKNSLIIKRINPDSEQYGVVGGRKIHLIRQLPGLSLTIFEGGHEMIVPQALALIPVLNQQNTILANLSILTLGDSNGTGADSWPEQIKKLAPYSTIINKSISGNTIGFDNLDRTELNTLRNIKGYLDDCYNTSGNYKPLDYILINLGTNDTKLIFSNQQEDVAENMEKLIAEIKSYITVKGAPMPAICIITPSPIDETKIDKEKYGGGDKRVRENNLKFERIAVKNKIDFLDTYSVLKKDFSLLTDDGIHLKASGQFRIAEKIAAYLDEK